MTPDSPRRFRTRGVVAANAPAAFLVGLVVLGVSVLLLGVLAGEGATTPLDANHVTARNDSVILSYGVPAAAYENQVLDVAYAFPEAPGDAYLLTCVDHRLLVDGHAPRDPLVHHADARDGEFSQALRGLSTTRFFAPAESAPGGSGASAGAGGGEPVIDANACRGLFVSFVWSGSNATLEDNQPDATVQVRAMPLDSEIGSTLFALSALGGLLALAGGIEWHRQRNAPAASRADDGAGTAETLYRLAERSEAWLARTRRYVLISGPLGIFLWYPVLIPWAWRAGRSGSAVTWMPWALAAGALLFLAGLTVVWAREFLRLDRELSTWRVQLAELRRREEALMTELDG